VRPETEQDYVEFVTHQANALCRTAYLLCGDWRRAEDATQEALIRLYRVWGRIQRKGAVGAYARKVVVSTTLDALRRKSSQEIVGGDDYFAHANATIKDGYWVHRVYTDDIRTGNVDPIYITMYDRSGKQVFKERY
jgi:DNA-directed RNA polymerase specialized sigma24 family protein